MRKVDGRHMGKVLLDTAKATKWLRFVAYVAFLHAESCNLFLIWLPDYQSENYSLEP